jgi:hypothetical protein
MDSTSAPGSDPKPIKSQNTQASVPSIVEQKASKDAPIDPGPKTI